MIKFYYILRLLEMIPEDVWKTRGKIPLKKRDTKRIQNLFLRK